MRVVIAPDKFAGTLTAIQAAAHIAEGWRSVRPDDVVVQTPLADGGEGTVDVIAGARPDAIRHDVEVADARGIATTAAWLELPDGTAVVEVAQVCGLSALDPTDRDPLRTTTYGVGQLLGAISAVGANRVVVGLGGSATVDGGAGMISALSGHAVRRADGNTVKVGGQWVADVDSVARFRRPPGLPSVEIASDVTNPLLGRDGAAAVFGPQKGADAPAVALLERALTRWADVVERDLTGGPWRGLPGAGAAGGLGFALLAFLDGQMCSGTDVVSALIGLDLTKADVVITGEGSLDAQTLSGKGPARLRELAEAAGATTVAIAGRIADGAGEHFNIAEPLGPDGPTDPVRSLIAAAARVAASFDAR